MTRPWASFMRYTPGVVGNCLTFSAGDSGPGSVGGKGLDMRHQGIGTQPAVRCGVHSSLYGETPQACPAPAAGPLRRMTGPRSPTAPGGPGTPGRPASAAPRGRPLPAPPAPDG